MLRLALSPLALIMLALVSMTPGSKQTGASATRAYLADRTHNDSPIAPPATVAEIHDHRAQDEWFYGQRAFPNAHVPAGALTRARAALPEVSATVSGNPWTLIGPAPISNGQINPTGPVSGRVTAIAADPTNSNVIYIGGAEGGVWKTTNGGTSWAPLTDYQSSLAIGALAIDPSNPNVIYAGTGENNFAVDSYYGNGVLKSVDAGGTWTMLGSSTLNGCRVGRIVIDPTLTSTLYLASLGSSGGPSACSGGIYKSIDGGVSWTRKLAGATGVANDLAIDPSAHLTLFAAVAGDGITRA